LKNPVVYFPSKDSFFHNIKCYFRCKNNAFPDFPQISNSQIPDSPQISNSQIPDFPQISVTEYGGRSGATFSMFCQR